MLSMKAIWNNTVIADSQETIIIEGNHYFPAQSIHTEYFTASNTHSFCGWKGEASYYSLSVAGKANTDAAWFYPDPKDAAKEIAGYVAFWKGVAVVE